MGSRSKSRSSSTNTTTSTEVGQQLSANQGDVFGISVAQVDGGITVTDGGSTRRALNAVNRAVVDVFEFGGGLAENARILETTVIDGVFETVEQQVNVLAEANQNALEFSAGAIQSSQNFGQQVLRDANDAVKQSLLFSANQTDKALALVDDAVGLTNQQQSNALEFAGGAFESAVNNIAESSEATTTKNFEQLITLAIVGAIGLAVVAGLKVRSAT